MTFRLGILTPYSHWPPNIPSFALQITYVFCLKHTVPVITDATNLFLYHLRTGGGCLPKTTLKPKLTGAGLAEHPKNFGTPLLISATIEASNFKFGTQVGFDE